MTSEEVVESVRKRVQNLSPPKNEPELHQSVLEHFQTLGLSCLDRKPIPSATGVSRPDLRVTSVKPSVLIEIKYRGDWPYVSQAAWQLFQAAKLLEAQSEDTRKIAIFGGQFTDPLLPAFLGTLDIEWICVNASDLPQA